MLRLVSFFWGGGEQHLGCDPGSVDDLCVCEAASGKVISNGLISGEADEKSCVIIL